MQRETYCICCTATTNEVHTFKNKNRHFCLSFIRSGKLALIETHLRYSTWWERDELINVSKYIIIRSGWKQSPVFYNKSCSKKIRNVHRKIPVYLFLIKNFEATLLKRDSKKVFPSEYCGIFKITCFEEHLQTAASISCYFDTINLKQSGFCRTYSFKVLVSERKYR